MLERVGLGERADHHPAQLSGGQQQRVAIARALVTEPLLILADEPTGALDSHTSLEIMALFQELNRQGMTVVLVTHEPDVARFARRILRFRDGKLVSGRIATARSRARSPHELRSPLLRVALRALAVNKLRSALTMLGIVIGVGAVIVMIAVGAGAQERVEEQIRALGSNLLLVMPGSTTAGGVRMGFGSGSTLTEDDVVAINREIPEALAAPALRGSAQVIWGNANWSTQMFGVTPEYLDVRQWPLAAGRIFEPAEMAGAAKVCLIGATVAQQLFGDADPVDQIDPHQARALHRHRRARDQGPEPDGHRPGRPDPDADQHRAHAACSARRARAQAALGRAPSGSRPPTASTPAMVEEQVRALLRQRHRLQAGRRRRFLAAQPAGGDGGAGSLEPRARAAARRGGLGVAAGRRHRHHEHHAGVGHRAHARDRPAHGGGRAHARHPRPVPGRGGDAVADRRPDRRRARHRRRRWRSPSFAGWRIVDLARGGGLAVAFAFVIGVFFGFYPARKAARLNPVEALRFE